jgi:hypothetical protein
MTLPGAPPLPATRRCSPSTLAAVTLRSGWRRNSSTSTASRRDSLELDPGPVVPILRVVEIVGITALTDRVRSLFGRDDDDPQHVVFFVGPP